MFEGDNVTMIENTFKRVRGVQTAERYFKEIMVFSANMIHIFSRLPKNEATVTVVVCRADVNVGLALVKMRSIVATETP